MALFAGLRALPCESYLPLDDVAETDRILRAGIVKGTPLCRTDGITRVPVLKNQSIPA